MFNIRSAERVLKINNPFLVLIYSTQQRSVFFVANLVNRRLPIR